MKIDSVKSTNIALLFPNPIERALITKDKILSLYVKEDQRIEDVKYSGLEAPGVIDVVLSDFKREFIFQNNRVIVNDQSGISSSDSSIIEDYVKIINAGIVNPANATAYGFNFDLIATPEEDFALDTLIGSKILKIINPISAGINLNYEEGGAKYNLEIKPLGIENKYFIHFNAHIDGSVPNDFKELNKQLIAQNVKFLELLKKI